MKWAGLTCVECVRVIVFAGRAEAGQAVIRDLQNKSTVHHAIRWLQISMAANVAVVEIVHSLVERSVKSNIKGCSLSLLFFPLQQIIHENTHTQTCGNNTLWQVDVCWGFWKGASFQGRQSVKLLLILFWEGGGGYWMYSCLMSCGNGESNIPQSSSAERCYLYGEI